jgi:1,4-dihydroxy-2-naphthoyl-CoA hydrolase
MKTSDPARIPFTLHARPGTLAGMPFSHPRTIHFADTDAAGVVFFANYLAICHEAYEEALSAAGIELNAFFTDQKVIVPIAKTEVEFLRPLEAGAKVRVTAAPTLLSENSFEVRFEILKLGAREKSAARVRTEHVCLDAESRKRIALPAALAAWVAAGA